MAQSYGFGGGAGTLPQGLAYANNLRSGAYGGNFASPGGGANSSFVGNGTSPTIGQNGQYSYAPVGGAAASLSPVGGVGAGGQINGNLPFAQLANPLSATSPQQGYNSAYLAALNLNAGQYQNELAGYGQTMAAQKAGQQGINQGYANLGNQVLGNLGTAQQGMQQGYSNLGQNITGQALDPLRQGAALQQQTLPGIQQGYTNLASTSGAGYDALNSSVQSGIQGIDASQRQAIEDAYAQQQGANLQSMASRGLGNTTITDAVNRGSMLDKQKADIALSNQTAALQAGYKANIGLAGLGNQSQIGLAGLGEQSQALQQQVAQQNLLGTQQAAYGSQIGQAGLANAQTNAQTNASYATQIGQAGLNYANQANQQNSQLAQNQLAFMNSPRFGYPDQQAYANAAQQAGANQRGAPGGGVNAPGGRGGGQGGGNPIDPNNWQQVGEPNNPFSYQLQNAGGKEDAIEPGYPNAYQMTTSDMGGGTYAPGTVPPQAIGPDGNPTAAWLQTQAGQQWLQTQAGQAYLSNGQWNESGGQAYDVQPQGNWYDGLGQSQTQDQQMPLPSGWVGAGDGYGY